MNFLKPDWDLPEGVGTMVTTRSGGVSQGPYGDAAGAGGMNLGSHVNDRADHVAQNRALLRACLPAEPVWLSQVHGVNVVNAAEVSGVPEADASFTTLPGVVCAILTADCLPVLFASANGEVVGAAHAGWRGLAGGVLENTAATMRAAGAGSLRAWMGPAIGPQRFEVGAEVREIFAARDPSAACAFQPVEARPGKYLADIFQLARLTLTRAGVEQVSGGGLCTVTDAQRFYSYRRNPVTGRMASLIWRVV